MFKLERLLRFIKYSGIVALNYDAEKAIIVVPDRTVGKALVAIYNPNREETKVIDAH